MLIKNRTANYGFAGSTGLLCGIFALVAFGPGDPAHRPQAGDRFGAGIAVILFAVMTLRALRMGVEVGPRTVSLRNFGSTKVLGWDQVRDLTTVDSGNITGRATCVALVLTTGEVERAMATASFKPAKVDTMLTKLQQLQPARAK